jgi:L-idonate 5-dehydrogenase
LSWPGEVGTNIVQGGLGGEMTLQINAIVAKEFDLRGAFRFNEEFGTAVELLNKGPVKVVPSFD